MHTVIDDHSRVAYTEVGDDETAVTAVAVLQRAVEWFADRGVTIERVLSDNGGAYRSHLWRDTCEALSITPKRTRPYRPQTNGKVQQSPLPACLHACMQTSKLLVGLSDVASDVVLVAALLQISPLRDVLR